MKLVYEPTSIYFRIRCQETQEEKICETEKECLTWAKKTAHTFNEQMTFVVTMVTEVSAEIEQVYGS